MEKSYRKMVRRKENVTEATDAVAAAVESLRRHSSRDTICSLCENNDQSRFRVIDVDNATGCVNEVKCKRCKETSYVCRSQCYCQRSPIRSDLESSYKEKLRSRAVPDNRRTVRVCSVMDAAVTLLRRNNNGDVLCPCGNNDQQRLKVLAVDRLGFITIAQCIDCEKQFGKTTSTSTFRPTSPPSPPPTPPPLPTSSSSSPFSPSSSLSPFEESYIVQMLYHEHSGQESVIQTVLNGDHLEHIRELCSLLKLHSFYAGSVCPEFVSEDVECCRVTATDSASGKVTEVEFDIGNGRLRKVQRLQITCRSGCYYNQCSPSSEYEKTYKEKMRKRLESASAETERKGLVSETRLGEAILSCTVLAANAAILRRHNIDNKLCQNCKNDDSDFLRVIEVDKYGFIARVQCSKCKRTMSTACHHSPFYYEDLHKSVRLERGDHISWHRNLAYWHHGIVTHADEKTLTVAHYGSSAGCSVTFHESIKRREVMMSPSVCHGTLHRVSYDDCYTNEYAALRAAKLVGEKRYNVLNRNCEHSCHRCKTGLVKSDQVMTCFSSVAKSLLSFFLRILNVALLAIFQTIHEKREKIQIDRRAFERFEHIVTSAYMLVVFLLFLVWSMYTECNKIKPTTDRTHCCGRSRRIACGLSIRIIAREVLAAAGPFLLLWFEDRIVPQEKLLNRQVTVVCILLAVTVVSYVFGAFIGTLAEYTCKRCCCRGMPSDQTGEVDVQSGEEIPTREIAETSELPSTSIQMETL